MALIVIHRDDAIELAAAGSEEEGVGRQWSDSVDALAAHLGDRGDDLGGLFAAAEQPVLAGMRIDAAHCEPWGRDAGSLKRFVSSTDRARHEPRLDQFDRVDDAEVGRHVDDAQAGGLEHH